MTDYTKYDRLDIRNTLYYNPILMHGMSLRPYEYKPMGTFLSAFYIHVVRQLIFYMTRHSISYIPFHILRGRNMNDINNMVLFFLWLYDYDEYENDCLFNNDNLQNCFVFKMYI